jgi:pimeloyl-ACP methyl ester carboxylesterase
MLGDSLRCVTFRAPAGAPGSSSEAPEAAASTYVPPGDGGPGTPVFLAPAFGLDGRAYERLAPLAARRSVVFWNLPNDLPKRGGVAALARMYLAHGDLAGMPRRFVFGGSSFGGTIALAAALEAPERCAGLVTMGTSPSWRQLGLRLHLARWLLHVLPARGFHRRFATVLFGPPGRSEDRDALRLQGLHRTKDYASTITDLIHEGGPLDLGHRLHEIRAPALVLHDPHERVVPADAADTLSHIRGSRRVDLPGAGHLPYVSRPEDVLAALEPFLEDVDRRERA